MKDIYLRKPESPFKLWKWLVFGPLFLFVLDYISSLSDGVDILGPFSLALGFMITVRVIGIRKLTWGSKLLGSVGLSLMISFIASIYLLGFCIVRPLLDLCAPNHLRADVFGNFAFPSIIVIVWLFIEIFGSFWKTINYVVRYWKR